MRELLGGKGANLAEMTNLGLPAPPGFTLATALSNWFYTNGRRYPDDLAAEVDRALDHVAQFTGRTFANAKTRCSCPSARALAPPCRA